jgi:hypothetical protein
MEAFFHIKRPPMTRNILEYSAIGLGRDAQVMFSYINVIYQEPLAKQRS